MKVLLLSREIEEIVDSLYFGLRVFFLVLGMSIEFERKSLFSNFGLEVADYMIERDVLCDPNSIEFHISSSNGVRFDLIPNLIIFSFINPADVLRLSGLNL